MCLHSKKKETCSGWQSISPGNVCEVGLGHLNAVIEQNKIKQYKIN